MSDSAKAAPLKMAHELMEQALRILDVHHPLAAASLDEAIVKLGLRGHGEGFPVEGTEH